MSLPSYILYSVMVTKKRTLSLFRMKRGSESVLLTDECPTDTQSGSFGYFIQNAFRKTRVDICTSFHKLINHLVEISKMWNFKFERKFQKLILVLCPSVSVNNTDKKCRIRADEQYSLYSALNTLFN